MSSGQKIRMTGLTVCYDGDPGEPFSGDNADNVSAAYGWAAARAASASLRYGPSYDLLAIAEQQDQLDIQPLGQSVLQRQTYLLERFEARHNPYGSTFVQLIADLIRTDAPAFTVANVRVFEDYANYSFSLEIDYSPDALMAARVERLVRETMPSHLSLTSISWGSWILDTSRLDVDHL
jgi:hypothetical protein